MSPMTFQKVRFILGELKEDSDYKKFSAPMLDERFHEFWQEVNVTGLRCMTTEPNPPTVDEIRERLTRLHTLAVGTLHRFRPYIDRAQAELNR